MGALAVPFMLRIAATTRPELRAPTFRLVAEIGRCQHMGDGPRDGLLQVAEEPLMIEDSTMCRVDWTIQAARHAVTDDLHLLLPLLADPAPELRSMTAYVLATASGDLSHVSSALQFRLAKEDDAAVRVSLIPAIAQLAREHQDENAPSWAQGLWSDPERPPEVRIGAGMAWLCLIADSAPMSSAPSSPTPAPVSTTARSSRCHGSPGSALATPACAASTKCSWRTCPKTALGGPWGGGQHPVTGSVGEHQAGPP